MIENGTVLDGKYKILTEVGKGGTSIVYLALDTKINKQWAIKMVKKSTIDKNNKIVYQNFVTESNLMKKLDHPALPRIVDILDNGDEISVVMDYIEGRPLSKVIKNHGAQPEELVVKWSKVLCDVLRYLHSQDPPIIYRDMKPGNVMLKPDGNIMLIDFGIAREYKVESSNDTIPMATPGFAPPEQATGICKTDARTDIYALGVTMFNLLTAVDPRTTQEYDIKKFNPSSSGGLQKIILRCTERSPENRFQTCEELMFALDHYNEIDDSYRAKLKHKLALFCVTSAIAVISLLCGIGLNYYSGLINSRDYDNLIGIAGTSDIDDRIDNYKKAVEIYPDRIDAYELLLNAYTEQRNDEEVECFKPDESNDFISVYNQYAGSFDKHSEDWLELNYQIGLTYFYYYTDADGNENPRDEYMRAYEYFEAVALSNKKNYKNYEVSSGYYKTCKFYKDYIGSSKKNANEPSYEECSELLGILNDSINNVEDYNESNSVIAKLKIYKSVLCTINASADSFPQCGISEADVNDIIESVRKKTESEDTIQESTKTLKSDILSFCDDVNTVVGSRYQAYKEEE